MKKETRNNNNNQLPGFFLRLLRWYCNPEKLEEIEGDLEELYFENFEIYGKRKAKYQFAWNVISCCKPYAWKRKVEFHKYYFNLIMLFSYLKIARRNFLKYKTFSMINIFGLSISMSVCLLIITILNDQLSYDNFHENGDRIYRVITNIKSAEKDQNFFYASTAMPVADALKNDYTGVENAVRLTKSLQGDGKVGDKIIYTKGIFADQSFLNVFSFKLKEGNPATALEEPYSVVLSKKTARIFFGDNNPIGQTIEISNKGIYTVTGIVEETPSKSHITFDLIGSISTLRILEKENLVQDSKVFGEWGNPYQSYVYLLLEEGFDPEFINTSLAEIAEGHKDASERHVSSFKLQKLSDVTPAPVMNNMLIYTLPIEGLMVLGFLALLIMLSACFNYTNLSISRALTRAREVGIRKVSGAMRWQVVTQFLTESVIFSMASLGIGFIIYKYLLAAFNNMYIAQMVSLNYEDNMSTYLWFVAFSLAVGIIAGLIPAIFLSSFKPLMVLKNFSGVKLFSKLTLRKSLIVLQFTLSLFFIITAIIISKQSRYLINTEYGFNKENIINIRLQDADADQYLNKISSRTDVVAASSCSHIPATGSRRGVRMRRSIEDEKQRLAYFYVDRNYIDNLELQLIAGNNFPENTPRENEQFIILNEQAIEDLNFTSPHEAIGESIILEDNDSSLFQIIGVLKNYYYRMLIMDINAMALRYKPDACQYVNVKIRGDNQETAIAGLEEDWREFDKVHAFDYQYFDEQLANTFGFINDLQGIIGSIAILAVIIASLGLLGMAIYNAESRVKEVGIRKVMGANIYGLVLLLSKGFIFLILIAIIIATPLAYFANNLWLQEIANHIVIGPGILVTGIAILLGLGAITVGSQSIRAAYLNPASLLKDE